MKVFVQIVNNRKPLTIFGKSSVLNDWSGFEYAPALQM